METQSQNLKEKLIDFLDQNPSHLNKIYEAFPEVKETTLRGRLNENVNKCFKRISKGMYLSTKGDSKALIIEGDAWEEIKNIEDNSIDTIITDSPYTCLNEHLKTGTTRKKEGKWGFETKDIDQELMQEMFRVLKPHGHFFCFLPSDSQATLKYNTEMLNLALDTGFEFNKRWIWNKVCFGMGYSGRNQYEQILFLSKQKRRMPYNKGIADVLTHKRINPRTRNHETEKPVELIQDIIKFSNKENDVVLDLFAGSLSLMEAGDNENVNTISIEQDKKIIDNAVEYRGAKLTKL